MSSAEIIALLCVLCLLPLWAAGSIIVFALGAVRCGRLMDPYCDGGDSGGKREHCPLNPDGPRGDQGAPGPEHAAPEGYKADWWPRFERELGRYMEEQESCPSGQDAALAKRGPRPRETPTGA
jgi:hypothetical protein